MIFGFVKQTEKQPKQISFDLFRFEPKKKFDCFEDTLGRAEQKKQHTKIKRWLSETRTLDSSS